MKAERQEALVGVVILAAVLLTVFGTLWLQDFTWTRNQQEMEAVFREVGQIKPGNAVKIRGVSVGRVRDIQVDPSGQLVRVRFWVRQGVVLPEDPVVILSPESLFGDWQAEVHPRSRFPNVNYPEVSRAGVLPGHALPDISQLTATADQISADIAVLTERIGIAFSDETARNIASLIENVEDVTERLSLMVSQQADAFLSVTDEVRTVTQSIGLAADEARELFAQAGTILGSEEVDSTLSDLAALSSDLRLLAEEMRGTNVEVQALAGRADEAFGRAQAVLERIEGGDGVLGRLLGDPEMAVELESALEEASALLRDIRENPRRYVRLSIF